MAFSLGAFAGGAATGYLKSRSDIREQDDADWKKKEREKQDAMDKELAERSGVKDYEVRNAKIKETNDQIARDTAVSQVGQEAFKNPAAGGIALTPSEQPPASTFSGDAQQRKASNPMMAGIRQEAVAERPVVMTAPATTGVGAFTDRLEKSKPAAPAPAALETGPTFIDQMNLMSDRLAIKAKYGKVNENDTLQMMTAIKKLKDENVDDAVARFHSGDIAGGLKAFNESGDVRGAVIVGTPTKSTYKYNGVDIPTTIVTVQTPDGSQRTINTAEYGASRFKMENTIKYALEGKKLEQTDRKLDNAITLEGMREDSRERRGDRRDEALLQAAEIRERNRGGITLPQQRTNAEIEAARKHIAGMSPEDIRKRTAQYSATGRENPDYDPTLAAKVRQANHRKDGADADFEGSSTPPAGGGGKDDISTKFSSDPAMKGHRLGNKTSKGFEVFDANGKLIGHYN